MTAYYAFNKEIADRYGISAAILLQYIHYWCKKNEEEGRNIIDGCAWTYNTIPDLAEQISCLTENQIRLASKKLIEAGLIVVGNHNRTKADRMKWYAVTDIALAILEPKEDAEKASSEGASDGEKKVKKVQKSPTDSKMQKSQMDCGKSQMDCENRSLSSNSIYINNIYNKRTTNKDINNSASPTPSSRAVDEPTSPTAKSAADAQERTQGNCPFFEILKAYNDICTSYPRMSVLDNERRRAILKLWKQYGSIDFFVRVFLKAEASAYLKGTNDRKWHADFDWIVKPSNFGKILDGKFDVLYERKQTQSTPIQSNRLTNPSFELSDLERIYAQAFDINTPKNDRKAAEA